MSNELYEGLELKKVNEADIEMIKKYKSMYSILKYEQQQEEYKEEYKERYMIALALNNEDISSDMFISVVSILHDLRRKVDKVREYNQKTMDNLVEIILMNLMQAIEKNDNDALVCARLFQYVTKSMIYSKDLLNYEYIIPFANDFNFSCYNGLPNGSEYEDILVTKEGTSFEIATLLTFLGRVFDVDIKTIPAVKKGKTFYINSAIINGRTTYIDAASAMLGKNPSNCCLVSKNELKKNGIKLDSRKDDYEDGVVIDIDMKHGSNIDKAISRERGIFLNLKITTADKVEINDLNEQNNKNR